jgi:tetratricopeptide (TPR) repeat protein
LLNELTLEAAPAGTPDQAKSIPFRNATADFNQRVSGGWGINGAIDGDDRTAWGVYPEVKQNHLAVFELAEDPGAGEGVRLTARLKHSSQYSNHNIGRFRMWVTDNSAVVSRELRWMAVRKVTDPLTRLAAAYHISGDQPGLDTLLQRHPEAGIYLADLYAADQDWERAIVEYRKVLSARPTDFSTLMKLTATLHAAGSPREAMSYMATASALDPKNSTLFLNVAAKQAWFEMENELNETCGRALKFSEDSSDPNYLERTAKICCLISVNDNARAESARTLAIKAIELVKDNGDLPWFQMALGMAEYRCGNFAEADAAMQVASESAASTPLIRGPATFFRAMSLYRQGQSDAARKLVDEAAAKMKPLPTTDRAAANAYHDEIIVWLAYKEAMGLIKFEAPTANPVKP